MLIFHWECLTINACFPENSFHFISGNSYCSKITGSTASMSVTREKGSFSWCTLKFFEEENCVNRSCVMEACVISTRTASRDGLTILHHLLPPFKGCIWRNKASTTEEKFSLDFPAPLTFMSSLYILNCVPQTAAGSCTGRWQPGG